MGLELLDKFRGLTPARAQQAPQVSALVKSEEGAVATAKALNNALLFTSHQFNVVRNMSELQLTFLVDDLLALYWFWKFDEFLFVLREGIRQNWGKTYDRFDPPTMHEWCKAYTAARELQLERDAARQADEHKKAELLPHKSDLRQHPDYGKFYGDARAQLQALPDGELNVTWRKYLALADAESQFVAAVATEVVNERRAAFYARQIAESLPGRDVPTARELLQQQDAEDRQVEAALRRGDRAGAGLPSQPVPGLYDNLPQHPDWTT